MRRLARGLLGLGIVATLAGVLPILAMRWVPPVTSAFMLQKRWPFASGDERCARVEYDWVPHTRIAPALFRAVLAAEDQRFAEHDGFDFHAIEEALEDAGSGPARGASTISQQVAKNLFLWPDKSVLRKLLEIAVTLPMEALWPKSRIMEIYLNIAEWGPGIFGVEAASRHHFSKPASRLTQREAALLAVALPNPFERVAGKPGQGTQRLAAIIEGRMVAAAGSARFACVLER